MVMELNRNAASEKELAKLLKLSTLTPGDYMPSVYLRVSSHCAVFVDGEPVLLFRPNDCDVSRQIASNMACSSLLEAVLRRVGIQGVMTWGVVDGARVSWQESYSAVVQSEAGLVEMGEGIGDLQVINLTQNTALTAMMCVCQEFGSILDEDFPKYDDSALLSMLGLGSLCEASG